MHLSDAAATVHVASIKMKMDIAKFGVIGDVVDVCFQGKTFLRSSPPSPSSGLGHHEREGKVGG
jgi:hypothetical protein